MRPALIATLLVAASAAFAGGGGTVLAKGQTFLAEVASTDLERARGLMYRQNLPKDRCMIFLFEEDGHRPFWMKNCLIYLDMVWITAEGRIVEMAERVPPPALMWRGADSDLPMYGGKVLARHVVEFQAGTVRRLGLKNGDRLGWDLTLDDGTPVKGGAPFPKGGGRRKK
ncbi:MAG: DUF192 domain-containing protein [Acidobacteria bacterium]|nr:DUF192 domain-containing protein [Acidobacteriota bacterium]